MDNRDNKVSVDQIDPNGIYVKLYFQGKNVDPDDITKRLGIVPSRKHKTGESHGLNNEFTWKTSTWVLDSRSSIQSTNVEVHLQWLLDQIEPVKSIIKSIASDKEVHSEIKCIFLLFSRLYSQSFSPEIIERISDLNINFVVYYHYLEY